MTRLSLLAGTALTLLPVSLAAAPCGTGPAGEIVCAEPGSDPVLSAEDDVTVVVTLEAEVISTDGDVTPVALSGASASIENDGLIAQQSADESGYAVTGSGDGLDVSNSGTIRSTDRGIAMLEGRDLTVRNLEGALIESRRQGIRSEETAPNARIENAGTIRASKGRAIQVRAFGSTVINTGTLMGGEEVVEARGDFTLDNSGTIRLTDESVPDEDGVQFADGRITNSGVIRGTDDGIDGDEGLITNSGRIVSLAPDNASNSGIDIDPVYENEIDPVRPAGPMRIVNSGLIEGPSAIGTDPDSTSEITVENTGILRGRGETAIRLAEGQGDSALSIGAGSEIYGDILFGEGDDVVDVDSAFGGALAEGVFDGGAGSDVARFMGLGRDALEMFRTDADGLTTVALLGETGRIEGVFRNFEQWTLGGETYTTAELDALTPVPLPAGLPLLAAGLGSLAVLRRRR